MRTKEQEMPIQINLKGSHVITSAKIMASICAPLQSIIGKNFLFRYGKILNNGSRVLLTNMPEVFSFFFEEGAYLFTWYDGLVPKAESSTWAVNNRSMPDTGRNLKREIEKIFLLTDGIDYIHNSETYMEIYTFASDSANIYKIKKQLLYRFIFYFKEQARELIDNANHSKIFIPRLVDANIPTFKEINAINFTDSTNIKKFYLNGRYQGIYLTSREVECLKYLVGRSFKEIAEILNVSKRTVERHIENIKKKLNVNKQSQLISFYISDLSRADLTA